METRHTNKYWASVNFRTQIKSINYVFTRRPTYKDSKNIKFVTGNLIDLVKSLKRQPGKDIWLVGGGQINTIMLNADLIDEFILSIHPIMLGTRISLFTDKAKRTDFKTINCKTFDSGLVQWTLHLKNRILAREKNI